MATLIEHDGKQYLLTVDLPEKEWIEFISHSLGITKEAVVGAVINQGLSHYVVMLSSIAEQQNQKDKLQKETDENSGDGL